MSYSYDPEPDFTPLGDPQEVPAPTVGYYFEIANPFHIVFLRDVRNGWVVLEGRHSGSLSTMDTPEFVNRYQKV